MYIPPFSVSPIRFENDATCLVSASSLILLTYPTSLYVNFKIPSIVHELGHALGMIHPMSRDDRDQYITLRAENINNGSDRNFLSISDRGYMYFTYGVPYDYKSIMHYNAKVIDFLCQYIEDLSMIKSPTNQQKIYTKFLTLDSSSLVDLVKERK